MTSLVKTNTPVQEKTQICVKCGGLGFFKIIEKYSCPYCCRTKFTKDRSEFKNERCHHCNGTGYLEREKTVPCNPCFARGFVKY
jgi:hypothetical protein